MAAQDPPQAPGPQGARLELDYQQTLVAVVGLAALFGIIVYDLRNTQFHDAAIHRAKELETALALARLSDKGTGGGLMNERPSDRYRFAGVEVWLREGRLAPDGFPLGPLAGRGRIAPGALQP
ncbi:MAG TPA: hypothetical protein VHY31_01725 [Streptosporangiaceae bacterium]|jgi:hypothetical protein|nr:hypothetical protein [Streptosporangiaceae bacterium]